MLWYRLLSFSRKEIFLRKAAYVLQKGKGYLLSQPAVTRALEDGKEEADTSVPLITLLEANWH